MAKSVRAPPFSSSSPACHIYVFKHRLSCWASLCWQWAHVRRWAASAFQSRSNCCADGCPQIANCKRWLTDRAQQQGGSESGSPKRGHQALRLPSRCAVVETALATPYIYAAYCHRTCAPVGPPGTRRRPVAVPAWKECVFVLFASKKQCHRKWDTAAAARGGSISKSPAACDNMPHATAFHAVC
jgi:hypothetical protein